MRLNVSKLKQALKVVQQVLPHVKDAVGVATVLNNQSKYKPKYKHKGKVNQALVGASAVVTGVSNAVDVVDVVSVPKSK